MKTLERNQLLEYLKHAIDLETAILTQKRIITEYEESSSKRKPELKEKALPDYPRRERVIQEDNTTTNIIWSVFTIVMGS